MRIAGQEGLPIVITPDLYGNQATGQDKLTIKLRGNKIVLVGESDCPLWIYKTKSPQGKSGDSLGKKSLAAPASEIHEYSISLQDQKQSPYTLTIRSYEGG